MRRLSCYLGRQKWERRLDGREKHWACAYCHKERNLPGPPDEHIPTAGPRDPMGGVGI